MNTISAEELLGEKQLGLPALEKAIDFSTPETELLTAARTLFGSLEHGEVRDAIKKRIRDLKDTDMDQILLNSSVSKPLINKYCLAAGPEAFPYRVWLHEFIPRINDKQEPYVEGEHNQRYPLASLILKGGYRATEYRWPEATPPTIDNTNTSLDYWSSHKKKLSLREATYHEGDVMILHTWESHALHHISSGTLTLLLEAPAVRHFSVAFDGPGKTASQIITGVEDKRRALLEEL